MQREDKSRGDLLCQRPRCWRDVAALMTSDRRYHIWKPLIVMAFACAVLLTMFPSASNAVTFNRTGARDWANTNYNNVNLYNNDDVRTKCTILGAMAWHFGGGIPMDAVGDDYSKYYTSPSNYGSNVTLTSWSKSWLNVWFFHNYFYSYLPSGLTYWKEAGWRCSVCPLEDDRFDGGQMLYYHHWYDNGYLDYHHLAVVSASQGVSFFTFSPGSVKVDLGRAPNFINLSDRYTYDERRNERVHLYKLRNL